MSAIRPPGQTAPAVLFLAGPPFDAALFRGVLERFGASEARSILDPGAPEDGWRERAASLANELAQRPTVLVAHGLAVPAAIAAALRTSPAALVLSNGPLRRLDAFTAALTRACGSRPSAALFERTALRPGPWLSWLASSAGLRRAVVNPYVMDRDTVASLCGPLVASAAGRHALASYVRSLAELPDPSALRCPVLLLWGDGDPLYPAEEAAYVEAMLPQAEHRSVPGGQHVHVEERPWETADRLGAWLSDQGLR